MSKCGWTLYIGVPPLQILGGGTCPPRPPPPRFTPLMLCYVTLSQTNSMYRHDCPAVSRDFSSNVNRHCHVAEAKQASFPCKDRSQFLFHPCTMSKSSHMPNTQPTSPTECRCLSHSVLCLQQALARATPVHNALTT